MWIEANSITNFATDLLDCIPFIGVSIRIYNRVLHHIMRDGTQKCLTHSHRANCEKRAIFP